MEGEWNLVCLQHKINTLLHATSEGSLTPHESHSGHVGPDFHHFYSPTWTPPTVWIVGYWLTCQVFCISALFYSVFTWKRVVVLFGTIMLFSRVWPVACIRKQVHLSLALWVTWSWINQYHEASQLALLVYWSPASTMSGGVFMKWDEVVIPARKSGYCGARKVKCKQHNHTRGIVRL